VSKRDAEDPQDKILFKVIDPEGVNVLLYAEQWEHLKKHPESRPVGRVRSGVQKPDIILSNEARNAKIYTTISSTNSFFNVIASVVSETECRITTAYIKNVLPKGDCTWRRAKK
jgi:hypothetical protein